MSLPTGIGYSRILTAYHGRVYIDPSTGRVLRLTTEVDPPPNFPIRETSTTIDYGFRAIGVEEYLLSVHAEVRTKLPSEAVGRIQQRAAWESLNLERRRYAAAIADVARLPAPK